MGLYPYNPNFPHRLQTDVPGLTVDRGQLAIIEWSAVQATAVSAVNILAATTLLDGEAKTVTTGLGAPPCPRNLSIKGNAAGITGNVTITGTDIAGEEISEVIAANGSSSVEGNLAFATVTEVVLPARNAENDTISVGYGNKLGLPYKLTRNTVQWAFRHGTRESTNPTVTVDDGDLAGNTVKLNSALNGTVIHVHLHV